MTAERCKHDLVAGECSYCQEPPPGLTANVIVTRGGQVFHRTVECPALVEGQRFADRKGHQVHDAERVALSVAQSAGRAACLHCFPHYRPGRDQRPGSRAEPPRAVERPRRNTDPLEELTAALDAAQRSVSAALAAGVDRGQLTHTVARALIAIRAQVWPDAAPARLPTDRRGDAARFG